MDIAAFVPASQTEALYSTAVSFQSREARAARRNARIAIGVAGAMTVLALGLGAAVVTILPTVRVVPVIGFINEAGIMDWTSQLSTLPPTTRVAGIEALLWQYVREREHYSPSEADQSYAVVSAMSDMTVRQQYQAWANGSNPESYAAKIGQKGFIRIARIGAQFVRHSDDYTSGVYQIRFCRTVAKDLQAVSERMVATMTYAVADTVPLYQRLSFNPAGVIVTEYPGVETEGVAKCG